MEDTKDHLRDELWLIASVNPDHPKIVGYNVAFSLAEANEIMANTRLRYQFARYSRDAVEREEGR